MDLNGKLLYSKPIQERHKELNIFDINIPAGVYVVNVTSDKQTYNGKLNFSK